MKNSYFRLRLKSFFTLLVSFSILFSGCTYKEKFLPVIDKKPKPNYEHLGLYILKDSISIHNNMDEGLIHEIGQAFEECGAFGGLGPGGALIAGFCVPINIPINIVKGNIESHKLEKLEKKHGTIESNVKTTDIQQILKNTTLEYIHKYVTDVTYVNDKNLTYKEDKSIDYSPFYSKGIDTIIEFERVEISFENTAITDIPTFISINVKSRLIRTKDNSVIDKLEKRINSTIHSYKKWIEDDFRLLKDKFHALLKTVVSSSVDEYLFLYYPTLPKKIPSSISKREAPYYVLKACYPKPIFATPDMREITFKEYERVGTSNRRFVPLYEERPTLKWELFPWSYDQTPRESFSDIVYDLEIHEYEGPLIYERHGLKKNTHQLEKDLLFDRKYLWSVRARFTLDDKVRFTEWGGLYGGSVFSHEDLQAWKFGKKRESSFWKLIDYETLDIKKYYYYPIMILK